MPRNMGPVCGNDPLLEGIGMKYKKGHKKVSGQNISFLKKGQARIVSLFHPWVKGMRRSS